jgi:hypothetical protein
MDFAGQLNISLANGWGIVRTVADLCMKQPDGKYLLVKDPNKVCRLFISDLVLSNAYSYSNLIKACHSIVLYPGQCFHW